MTLDVSEHFLDTVEEGILLRVARASLVEAVVWGQRLDVSGYPTTARLQERHGAFVTLFRCGELRGCVGYIANCEPLICAVRDSTYNAALRDARFLPVKPEELPDIHIEISALTPGDSPDTPFKTVYDIDEIRIGRDGVYVERPPQRGGVLLPQVAVEEGWNVPTFLAAACRKAGYEPQAWREPDVRICRFSAQVFGEPP